MQAEEGAPGMPPLVEVMHAQAILMGQVMRPEIVARQVFKPLVRRAQGLDHGVLSLFFQERPPRSGCQRFFVLAFGAAVFSL